MDSRDQLVGAYRRGWLRTAAWSVVVLAVITVCAYFSGLLDPRRLADGLPSIGILLTEMIPPDFSAAGDWVMPLVDTIAMSVAGTALGVAFALPLALLGARNTTPHPVVYHLARGILNFFRSIPELIMGIIFVAAVGFGALSGVLALGLHSIGMVGKFFSETIEHVDRHPVEAARAAGGTPLQVISHGVLPQVLPQMADVSIYRWEYNFRASTVMGMVGAGGIGFELMASLRVLKYEEVSAILIIILVMVTLVDSLSAHIRRRFQ